MNEGIQSKSRIVAIAGAWVLLSSMVASGPAAAGAKYGVPGVVIQLNSNGSGTAYGTLGGTRNSANLVERISCFVSRIENGSTRTTSITCAARDLTRSVTCTSSSETVALGLNGAMNDGLIEFTWDSAGKCTNILAYESSSLERKR
jgi:hypothetical protein